jgi:DNA polymerase III delta prime subunit
MFIPRSLNDFPISDPVSRHLLETILAGEIPFPLAGKNGICLWGSYGTGKTTLAQLLPALMESGGHLPLSPLAGSGIFGRSQHTHFTDCRTANANTIMQGLDARTMNSGLYSQTGWHYEIFDEFDQLTPHAQGSMKATMSSPRAQYRNVMYLFTTNDRTRIDKGVESRCHMIEMNMPSVQDLVRCGHSILRGLGHASDVVSAQTLAALAAHSRGDFRDFTAALAIAANRARKGMP